VTRKSSPIGCFCDWLSCNWLFLLVTDLQFTTWKRVCLTGPMLCRSNCRLGSLKHPHKWWHDINVIIWIYFVVKQSQLIAYQLPGLVKAHQAIYLFISPPNKYIIIFDGNKDLWSYLWFTCRSLSPWAWVQSPKLLIGPICSELWVPFAKVELHLLSNGCTRSLLFPV
jgi:hypothetical protein